MPLNENGFEVRRFEDVSSDLFTSVESKIGTITRDENSVISILLNNISSELTDLNELAKSVYDSYDIYSATGVQLDNRAAQLGIYRQGERSSRGYVQFYLVDDAVQGINNPVTIPIGTQMSNTKGTVIKTLSSAAISAYYGCWSCEIEFTSAQQNVAEEIRINGNIYSFTPSGSETVEVVTQAILDQLDADTTKDFTVERSASNKLKLQYNSVSGNGVTAVPISNTIFVAQVVGSVLSSVENVGAIEVGAKTVTTLTTNTPNVDSVDNETEFLLGSDIETDSEFRSRYLSNLSFSGVATLDAIQDKVSNLDGVENVYILENDTPETVAGKPPHSFEVIVSGGSNQSVGQTIWNNKPASARTYGSISQGVIDLTGKEQTVYFSRPIPLYVWVEVTYKLYDEEIFPSDGRTKIAAALGEYSSELALGEDLFPQKFLGSVYGATDGLGEVTIRLATSGSSQLLSPETAYTSDPIQVDDNKQPLVLASKVTFIESV